MLEEEFVGFAVTGEKPVENKEEKKVEIKPYKVFNQDFSLSDPDFIDYYKTRMKMMAIKYHLCGRVNDQGQYKIADPIRYDLIRMEKEIEETGEDFYTAIALYMQKHFYFHIKITQIEDGKAKASLFLSELVDDFLGIDKIVSHVGDYVDNFDDDFRIKVRKAFNLVDVSTKVDDFAVPNLAVVMQDSIDLELVVGPLYDMASQIFVMRLLKALEASGENGALVLAKYKELLASNQIEVNEKFRYSSYKALLDRAVDELGGYEKLNIDPNLTKAIIKEINGTVKAIDNASGKSGYVEVAMPKQAEAKQAPSVSKGGSKGGNKSSSGGGNKTGNKKQAKKSSSKKQENSTQSSSGGVSASSYDVKAIKIPKKTPEKEENNGLIEENNNPAQEEQALPPPPEQGFAGMMPPSERDENSALPPPEFLPGQVTIEETLTLTETTYVDPKTGKTIVVRETERELKIESEKIITGEKATDNEEEFEM